ncbi:DUF397 domain-containing protein [Streptomyces sp. NPDC054840]
MDDRLRDFAKGSPNFGVLYQRQPLLSLYGASAEATVFTHPNSSLVQAGQFGEVRAEELLTRIGMRIEGDRQVDRLTALTRAGVLVPETVTTSTGCAATGTRPRTATCSTRHVHDARRRPQALRHHSGGQGDCVEVADNIPGIVPVRDSKRPAGPVIGFGASAWQAFVTQVD